MKNLIITTSVMASLFFISCENEANDSEEITLPNSSSVLNDSDAQQATAFVTIFEDNFDQGTDLKSSSNWTRVQREDYNSDICDYVPWRHSIANKDGASCLRIEASEYRNTGNYRSGLLKSKANFHPRWREELHFQARIKVVGRSGNRDVDFDQTNNLWPAFWTVREEMWPTRGEIDIMESYSFGGSERFASNLFYGTQVGENLLEENASRVWSNFSSNSNNGWHVYDMYWRNNRGSRNVRIVVDGVERANYTNSVDSDLDLAKFTNHNIMLNLNVGDNDTNNIFPGAPELFDKAYMYVDYVKVERRSNI